MYRSRRGPFSNDIRLANEQQEKAIIDKYSQPIGTDLSVDDYRERGHFIRENCDHFRRNLKQWPHRVLVPHSAHNSPAAIQCVANMEKRRCLVRREGENSITQTLTGFYVCGVYCAKPLRSGGIATHMILQLFQSAPESRFLVQDTSFSKVFDEDSGFLTDKQNACFFGETSSSFYDAHISRVVTPGICHLKLPLSSEGTLELPEVITIPDKSEVRFLTMETAAAALQRYEGVLRKQLESPSDLDRFCDIPDFGHFKSWCLTARWFCEKFNLEQPHIIGVEIEDKTTGDWSFLLMGYGFVWKILHTWAAHFANAQQLAALLRALSDSKQLLHSYFPELCVNNVPLTFAHSNNLPYAEGFCNPKFAQVVRLPDTPWHRHRPGRKVHWIGIGQAGSSTRS